MRIIQFTDTFLPVMDGVGNVVVQYAMNMGEKGHDVYVVTPQTHIDNRGQYPFELVDYLSVPLVKLKSYRVGEPLLDAHCRNRLKHIEADIVHVHSPFVAGHAGLAYAKRRGCPIVGTFHSKYYDDFLQLSHSAAMAGMGAKWVAGFYKKLDAVWAVSAASAGTLREYGYPGEPRVMVNGTDVRALDPAELAAVRAKYAPDGAPLLLYVGQINWKKNLRRVLEACAGLKRPFRLALAGQGPHEKDVAKLAETLGLGDRVSFTGHITDTGRLDALYAAASLFLFPSLYDNSPLVVREAAAMGTPAIVVAGSSAAEGIRDGFNGFLCQDDSADLARVAAAALEDPRGLVAIGENARKTIPIPWTTLVDQVLYAYEEIIRTRSRKGESP